MYSNSSGLQYGVWYIYVYTDFYMLVQIDMYIYIALYDIWYQFSGITCTVELL